MLEDGQASVFLKEAEIVFEPFIFTPEVALAASISPFYQLHPRRLSIGRSQGQEGSDPTVRVPHERSICSTKKKG